MNDIDFITQGEEQIQKALLSENFFQGITVLKSANGDLAAKIEEAIATLGLFIGLRIAEGKIPVPGDSEPWKLFVVISENALLNRGEGSTGKTARLVLQKIIVAAAKNNINLETATEIIADDGPIVWQITGTAEVYFPCEPA